MVGNSSRTSSMDRSIPSSLIRRRRLRKTLIWAAVAVAVVGLALWTISSIESTVLASDLRLASVELGSLETTVNAQGRIIPAYEQKINSPISTNVIGIYANAGDTVQAGQALLQLDLQSAETELSKMIDQQQIRNQEAVKQRLNSSTLLAELEMQVSVKEMELNVLKVDVVNEQRLDSLGSGTGDRVRKAQMAYQTAQLELEQLRKRLDNERLLADATGRVDELTLGSYAKDVAEKKRTLDQGRIPAPRDGVLTYIISDLGTNIVAGTCVAVVSDLSHFKVEGEVSESQSNLVSAGSEVTVRVGSDELNGIVTSMEPQASGGVVRFNVALNDQNPRLRPGLRVDLYVSYGYKDKVMRLPIPSGFKGRGEYELFVMDGDNHLVRRHVTLGDSNRDYVEVLSGLKVGDCVAVGDMKQFERVNSLKIKK